MVVKTLVGKSKAGDIIIYEYQENGGRKETFLPGKNPRFIRIEDCVLVVSDKKSVSIDSNAIICSGKGIYWKDENNIGHTFYEILDDNIIYNSELEPAEGISK